ncbi:hypothetical protein AV530_011716 [Patagioenas fasciata monilis]|uniref:Uncharacterized protein n=1 Tax=Patagioenas fasciata monilis TaxID=372326 RepID=A0A1V4KLD0_PATFA|nr:hypothetical protein AV530_011716 [Patagioenas fasciata monilis]
MSFPRVIVQLGKDLPHPNAPYGKRVSKEDCLDGRQAKNKATHPRLLCCAQNKQFTSIVWTGHCYNQVCLTMLPPSLLLQDGVVAKIRLSKEHDGL